MAQLFSNLSRQYQVKTKSCVEFERILSDNGINPGMHRILRSLIDFDKDKNNLPFKMTSIINKLNQNAALTVGYDFSKMMINNCTGYRCNFNSKYINSSGDVITEDPIGIIVSVDGFDFNAIVGYCPVSVQQRGDFYMKNINLKLSFNDEKKDAKVLSEVHPLFQNDNYIRSFFMKKDTVQILSKWFMTDPLVRFFMESPDVQHIMLQEFSTINSIYTQNRLKVYDVFAIFQENGTLQALIDIFDKYAANKLHEDDELRDATTRSLAMAVMWACMAKVF